MKKTLITLAALAVASVATAADNSFSVSTDTETYTSMGNGIYRGWVGSLTDGYLSTDTTLADTVILSKISVAASNDDWTTATTSFKLAIFAYDGDVSDSVSSSEVKALSTSIGQWTKGGTLTFSFDSVELSKSTDYRFFFVSSDSTVESCSPWEDKGAAVRLRVVNVGTTLTGSDCLLDSGSAGAFSGNYDYAPNVSYTVSNKAVPEPATATLSLLALAGLAARRRRK